MARKKPAAEADAPRPENQDAAAPVAEATPRTDTPPQTPAANGPSPAGDDAGRPAQSQSFAPAEAGEPRRSKWVARFDSWGDHEAGVTLIEDRKNRRMTIRFVEKPPEAVRKLLKEEHGYRFDTEDQVWWKPISPAKARQGRDEADELAFQAANLIRQEKGLEPNKAFHIGL